MRGNDIIKNFKLESFDGISISSDGSPLGNQSIRFEEGAFWQANQDDITIDDIYIIEDEIYLKYRVDFHIKININTNVLLTQASPEFEQVNEVFEVSKYKHRKLDGSVIEIRYNYIEWQHYNFGTDLQKFNA